MCDDESLYGLHHETYWRYSNLNIFSNVSTPPLTFFSQYFRFSGTKNSEGLMTSGENLYLKK